MSVPVLQPGEGALPGAHVLLSTPGTVSWGWLPNADSAPVLTVPSRATVTVDALSHEGIMADQGRDPVAFLAGYGVAGDAVLRDAVEIAASDLPNGPDDGPHVVTGPVAVAGARPGDVLRVDVLDLVPRQPYGFVSSRHGLGALPGELPEGGPVHFEHVAVTAGADGLTGSIAGPAGRRVRFPLAPFLGVMGVAPATGDRVHSVPPGDHGGNIDVKHAVAGSTLYLPVAVDGASFYLGDPHYAQGNGEVALTAVEASLRATLRLTVLSGPEAARAVGSLRTPVLETATHWLPTGLDEDLAEAMRRCTRNAVTFLAERFGLPRNTALAYLSAAADFEVTQVVDRVTGVHCLVRKADFAAWV